MQDATQEILESLMTDQSDIRSILVLYEDANEVTHIKSNIFPGNTSVKWVDLKLRSLVGLKASLCPDGKLVKDDDK